MILRAGLTGGMACGKSTVARTLAECGIPVLDADRIVHALYEPGAEGAAAVAAAFGPAMLASSGAVDRKALAAAVFGDAEKVRRLNALVHPLVHKRQASWFAELEREGHALGVVEATLLFESGGRSRFDIIVAVSAPQAVRIERALARTPGITAEEARSRMNAQWPDSKREELADIVIRNEGTLPELIEASRALAATLLKRAVSRPQRT